MARKDLGLAQEAEPLIPRAIERELEKLVRDRDRWKRRALDRAVVRSKDRRHEIDARDKAVRELLFLAAVEGMSSLSRGGKGCVWRAVELLRPDIAKVWGDEDARTALKRFFPDPDDLKE